MRTIRTPTILAAATVATVLLAAPAIEAGEISKAQTRRSQIDQFADETLSKLFQESQKARRLYDSAVGYAIFDSAKFAVGLSGGGGVGVAIDKRTGEKTYMKMGTAGIGFGLGGQVYQIVFLFEDEQTFKTFVQEGWEAGATANAVAGREGANAQGSFVNGLAVYQLTEAGLMLQADISGTKYWKYRKLNEY